MVGSLVSFIDGLPFKPGYRRYKIKSSRDRRFRLDPRSGHAAASGRRSGGAVPDIWLIDGGKGQLSAALDVFETLKVVPPTVISLAKQEEEIYVRASEPFVLSRHRSRLRLLQYVRDEAHRFAQHYHHFLRKKRTFGDEG